jgi:hypothetical protein
LVASSISSIVKMLYGLNPIEVNLINLGTLLPNLTYKRKNKLKHSLNKRLRFL